MRVFVSSTVYDLLDLRSVVEKTLSDISVLPVLSEYSNSAFDVAQDQNSIGACLVNVASSDAYVCILDKKYGPTLAKAGYENISATHLEYRHALKNNVPIHFFVRDRLESDFCTWKKNGRKDDIKYSWCEDASLFSFLEEHRKLDKDSSRSNWIRIFSNAIDLSAVLRSLFEQEVHEEKILNAIQSNRFPLFTCTLDEKMASQGKAVFCIRFRNDSTCPAFDFQSYGNHSIDMNSEKIVQPNEELTRTLVCFFDRSHFVNERVSVSYNTLYGVRVLEEWDLSFEISDEVKETINATATNISRRFVRSLSPSIKIDEA